MHFRSLIVGAVTALLLAGPSFATNLNRCENLADIVNPDTAAVDHTRVDDAGVSNLNGDAWTKATYCGAAAPGTCTGESLSERVESVRIDWTTFDGYVADTPQFHTGKVDVKKSIKASAEASAEATKNHPDNIGKPVWKWKPVVVVVEVVNWNAVQTGSC